MNNDNYKNHNDNNKGSFLKSFVLSPFKVIWRHYNITQMFGFDGMFPKIIFSTKIFLEKDTREFSSEKFSSGKFTSGCFGSGEVSVGEFDEREFSAGEFSRHF